MDPMAGRRVRTKSILLALFLLAEAIIIPSLNYVRIYHNIFFDPPDPVTWEWIRDRQRLWIDHSIVSVVLVWISTAVIVLEYPRHRSIADQIAYMTFIWCTFWGLCPPLVSFCLCSLPFYFVLAGFVYGVVLVIVGCVRREWKYPAMALVSSLV